IVELRNFSNYRERKSTSHANIEECSIVVDTNIFIWHLACVKKLLHYNFKAKNAVQFIHRKLKANYPRLRGHVLSEMMNKESMTDQTVDDSIIRCCLQIAGRKKNVVLLSNDINLQNKAMINGIKAYQIWEIFEALKNMKPEDHDQGQESTDHKTVTDHPLLPDEVKEKNLEDPHDKKFDEAPEWEHIEEEHAPLEVSNLRT
ncbi:hypothetical protein C0J52_08744, partial [Blattella germanica]